MKYKKPKLGKQYKFGDYLEDAGRFLADSALMPFETLTGKDLVDTGEYNDKTIGRISNTKNAILGSVGKAALNVALPGVGQAINMAGQMVGSQLNAPDLQQNQVGNMAGQLMNASAPIIMAQGGQLTEFQGGGTHEQNPNGGIPVGQNALVEEGETMDDKFVFSDRLKVNKTLAKEFNLPKKAIGKTFAEVSKLYNDESRPTDKISKRGYDKEIANLKQAQEAYKAVSQPQQSQIMANGGKVQYSTGGLLTELQILQLAQIYTPDQIEAFIQQLTTQNVDVSSLQPEQFNQMAADYINNPQLVNAANKDFNFQRSQNPTNIPAGYMDVNSMSNADISQMPFGFNTFGKTNSTMGPQPPVSDDNTDNSDGINWQQYATMARFAPVASSLVNLSMLNKPEAKDTSMFNTNMQFNPNLIDAEQIARDIESSGEATRNVIRNTRGNQGTTMANLVGSQLQTDKAIGNANVQIDGINQQELARTQGLTYDQAMRNVMTQMEVQQMNDHDRGAYQGALMDSVASVGQNVGAVGNEFLNMEMVKNLPIDYFSNMTGQVNYNPAS